MFRDYGVLLTPERQLAGAHFRVMRYRMKNTGYVTRALTERQFWQKGVRAVMLSTGFNVGDAYR